MGDKVHSREGNSPDRKLRSLNYNEVKEGGKKLRQLGGGLRSSHPLKKA